MQHFQKWPPYQVSDSFYPFNNSSEASFVVGNEDCSNDKVSGGQVRQHVRENVTNETLPQVGYCNGPLKSGYSYRFKIRAYTSREQHSETVWSNPIKTDPGSTELIVVLGIMISMVALLVLVFVVLRAKRCDLHSTLVTFISLAFYFNWFGIFP